MTEEKYVLTRAELLKLIIDQKELEALNCGGVHNWEWYGDEDMFDEYEKMKGEDISEEECKAIQDEALSKYKLAE